MMDKQFLNMRMVDLLGIEQSCTAHLEDLEKLTKLYTQKLMDVQAEMQERLELNSKIDQLNTLLSEVMLALKSRDGALRFINTATGEVLTDLTADQFRETGDCTETVIVDYVVGC